MQSIAEGFEILQASEFPVDLKQVAALWQHGSVVRSWLLDLLVLALEQDPGLEKIRGYVDDSGEGRWTVLERDRRERAGAGDHARALRPLRLAPGRVVRREGERRAPQPVRRPCRSPEAEPVGRHDPGPSQRRSLATRSPKGLRLPRTPDPCALVIFGASGDLTQRKLFPADLLARRPRPAPRAVRDRRRRAQPTRPTRSSGERMKEAVREFGRDPLDEKVWRRLAAGMRYVCTDLGEEGGEEPLARRAGRARRGAGHRRQPRLLPRRPAERDLGPRRPARAPPRRVAGLDAPDRREALRLRPGERAAAERGDPALLRGGRDLPDRPLPRQGDGPEPAGAPVRERDLRADLEPPVRRPRRDHRRRVDRDRGARLLLRAGGRDPGRLPEPPAPARRPDRDGAAGRLHARSRCGTRR